MHDRRGQPCGSQAAIHRLGPGHCGWRRRHADGQIVRWHLGCSGDTVVHGHVVRHAEVVQAAHQFVITGEQGLNQRAVGHSRPQTLSLRFHAVGHFTQTQGTCQTCTAFEGVQVAQHLDPGRDIFGTGNPLAQSGTQARQQFLRLFVKNLEQVCVERVHSIDVVVDRCDFGQSGRGAVSAHRGGFDWNRNISCNGGSNRLCRWLCPRITHCLGGDIVHGDARLIVNGLCRLHVRVSIERGIQPFVDAERIIDIGKDDHIGCAIDPGDGNWILHRSGPVHEGFEGWHEIGRRLLQEPGCKLVQQAPDVLGSADIQSGLVGSGHLPVECRMGNGRVERMLQRSGQA